MFPFEFVPPIYFHFPQYKHSINEIILVSFPFLQNQWWYWTKNLILLMPSFVSITWCLNFPCPFQSESWMFRGSYLFGSKFWVFSVESFRKAIGKFNFNNCGQYPAKVIWLRYALPMISFFCWAAHRRLTSENLRNWNFILIDCVACGEYMGNAHIARLLLWFA